MVQKLMALQQRPMLYFFFIEKQHLFLPHDVGNGSFDVWVLIPILLLLGNHNQII